MLIDGIPVPPLGANVDSRCGTLSRMVRDESRRENTKPLISKKRLGSSISEASSYTVDVLAILTYDKRPKRSDCKVATYLGSS